MTQIYWLDSLAIVWFALCWFGYSYFARHQAKQGNSLISVLHDYRQRWMVQMLARENRVADAALLANHERQATFFASTTLLILAGLTTVLTAKEGAMEMLAQTFDYLPDEGLNLTYKVFVLIIIFVYGFFTFTWALRQYGFCSVLVGAAPETEKSTEDELKQYAYYAAKVLDQASHSRNRGLRSYYFAMAVMAWFINSYLFIAASTLVVIVLYCREFRSRTFSALRRGIE